MRHCSETCKVVRARGEERVCLDVANQRGQMGSRSFADDEWWRLPIRLRCFHVARLTWAAFVPSLYCRLALNR